MKNTISMNVITFKYLGFAILYTIKLPTPPPPKIKNAQQEEERKEKKKKEKDIFPDSVRCHPKLIIL